jgi:hypothetical protein
VLAEIDGVARECRRRLKDEARRGAAAATDGTAAPAKPTGDAID